MDGWTPFLQWPAMVTTLIAAWLVASNKESRRKHGFWWFTSSNALWVAWGLHDGAYALVALQFGLLALNLRGVCKSAEKDGGGAQPGQTERSDDSL